MDLIVRNARLSDRQDGEPFDIGIDKGRIVAIEKNLAADGQGATTPRTTSPAPA